MSERDTSAPAETAPVRDYDREPSAHDVALTLADNDFDFDEDDGDPNPGDPAYDHAERVIEQPRGEKGRFAPRNPQPPTQDDEDGEDGDESDVEPEDDGTDADGPEANADGEPDKHGKGKDGEAKDTAKVVEIDGHQVPIDEVRRGFMRQADYTRKTQAHAEEVRQFQTIRQQTEAERGELGNILNIAVEVLRTRMPSPPDRNMIRTDPMGFMEQQQAYQEAVEEVNKLLSAQQSAGQRQTEEQKAAQEQSERARQAQTAEALQREAQLMAETMPELRTPEGQQAFFADATKFGERYNLSANDVMGIQDHRALRVLKDAIAYQKLQAKKPEALQKLRNAPPIRAAVRQSPGTRQGQASRQARDAFSRNPTIDGAVAALPDSLFGID
ncbi:hypothetical protein IPV08_15980 [Methylobacterium sp. SD274]|uniref:hypothetical protein n=1 Tax=Methylobacterium sp. SD274 TaxID=2782009 RepID=UPI001A9791A7|nr:hypothetical protein [Methylobacterium sp. SD274]MBO1021460.1 hypothetical protein [Methylobacterium sp. SD274]